MNKITKEEIKDLLLNRGLEISDVIDCIVEINLRNPEEILREYVEFDDVNGSKTVELLPLTIIDCMEEYAEEVSDAITELHCKPMQVLKPIEDLWRKENSPNEYVLPDRTKFFKWIVNKILRDENT